MTREGQLVDWVEQVAAQFAAEEGLPLIAGRLLGHLLVCSPPERTAAELSQELEASTGSISTNVRLLCNLGLVIKTTRRGRQAATFRLDEDRWADIVRRRFERVAAVRQLTATGLRLLSGDPERAKRLRAVDDLYGWLADELPPLWERWDSRPALRR